MILALHRRRNSLPKDSVTSAHAAGSKLRVSSPFSWYFMIFHDVSSPYSPTVFLATVDQGDSYASWCCAHWVSSLWWPSLEIRPLQINLRSKLLSLINIDSRGNGRQNETAGNQVFWQFWDIPFSSVFMMYYRVLSWTTSINVLSPHWTCWALPRSEGGRWTDHRGSSGMGIFPWQRPWV